MIASYDAYEPIQLTTHSNLEWYRQLARLLEATAVEPQASFKKYAAYFISDYVQSFHSYMVSGDPDAPSETTGGLWLGEAVLRELMPGVFAMLAACQDDERKMIHNAANAAGKNYFRQLISDYNETYKYKGDS